LRRHHDVVSAERHVGQPLASLVTDREIVIFRSGLTLSAEVMGSAPRLKLLIRAGSGLDNVDLAHARSNGIRVVRVPGPSAQAVAELTFGLMLSLARNVALADRLLRQGHWPKHELGGPLLGGKTLGIVGLGNIGTRVGELGAAWRMRVLGCVRAPSPRLAAALEPKGIELTDIDNVLAHADVVSVHVPLDATTRGLIGGAALARMKRGAMLINTSRGGVVDEEALRSELGEGGRLAGAALDVHASEGEGTVSPLADLPNVVLTPHIGGMATDSQRQIGERMVQLIDSFADGRIGPECSDGELVV
jgi:D-3-phosphoglycerate dehydrogenase / 2-oxoglutarate reductase